jgi:YegS/Rv2252/BmrU family lipid kinase
MKIMVLYNDTAGKSDAKATAEAFQTYLEEHDPESVAFLQPSNPDIKPETIQKNAQEHQIDSIAIIGGDGTIHHVLQTFVEQLDTLTVGIIPGGTVNNFARMLGIPLKHEEAFATILTGDKRKVDYGLVNDSIMISTLTIGLLADTAAATSQEEKQQLGPLAFVKRFLHYLIKKKQYKLEIITDGKRWRGKSQLLTVIMSNSAGGFTNFDELALPDDGLFHLILLPKLSLFAFIFNLPRIIRGQIAKVPGVLYFTAKEIDIRGQDKTVYTRTDGDPTDNLPIKMKVVPQALSVRVPKDTTGPKNKLIEEKQ